MTRDQHRALLAFERIKRLRPETNEPQDGKLEKSECDKYGSMAHALPILIRQAGLAQALSFVATRKSEGQKRLLEDLNLVVNSLFADTSARTLDKRAREESGLLEYQLLTREVIANLVWFKRYAVSFLDVDASVDTTEVLAVKA
jgi:CRISPR-associated protein Cmr5